MHTRPWHTYETAEAISALGADTENGLTSNQAESRLAEYGRNMLTAGNKTSALALFLAQFKNVFIIILLLGAGLSLWLGHGIEAASIGIIVVFSAGLSFFQEYRAERAMEMLQKLSAPDATVLRDGEEKDISAEELVPGDVVLFDAGDKVPADARIVSAMQLSVDESPLTGESVPVSKTSDALVGDTLPVGDRKNMVFAGTTVTQGRGSAVIALTGMKTEFGTIAGLLQTVKSGPTPLQKNLDRIGHMLAVAAIAIIAVIVVAGLARGEPMMEMVIFGIALAVAVVPEALPAVVTISLAIGVQRMIKRNALVRKLPTVETLGSTTIICTDKTGTLTKNEMTVRRLVTAEGAIDLTGAGYKPQGQFQRDGKTVSPSPVLLQLLRAATLSSDARLLEKDGVWIMKGDPTEGSLVVAAAKAGIVKHDLDDSEPRVSEIAFTSESKRMTTLHETNGGVVAYAKGAPEVLLESCTHEETTSGAVALTEDRREAIRQDAKGMAAVALRVLGVAKKHNATMDDAKDGLTFLGLAGMIDPPRAEAKEAIARCHTAGIRVAMITGDHPVTAEAIARELGLLRKGRVVTGAELDAMGDDELRANVHLIDIFARVSPSHKLRVVTVLQGLGEVVAMTGDGVNDAPALKKADIGIAMGITGTDVSKEAATMTLTDDNFASIVAAVEEGRGIFDNIRKYLLYLLSSNFAEIAIIGVAFAANLPSPLTAVQILYINLVTDGLPAMALSVEVPERDIMHRRPRNTRSGVFNRAFLVLMASSSIWAALRVLFVYAWALHTGRTVETAMTMAFFALMFGEFAESFVFRSFLRPTWNNLFGNRWLIAAIAIQLPAIPLMFAFPTLRHALGIATLTPLDWGEVIISALLTIVVMDTVKYFLRKAQGSPKWMI